jgi:ABC-type amino acid transport substrate-binding protein
MKFTNPYLESRVAFVMKKKYRKKFRSVSDILKDPSVKVVVRKATSYEQLAQSIFPPSKVVVIDDYDIYTKQYSNDILLRGEFQLISWSLFHPKYSVIIPDPLITKEVFGYAIAEDADKWLFYLNLWLQLKKVEGLSKQEFDFWVLGKTQNAKATTRRWSIIRDVLGWTEN